MRRPGSDYLALGGRSRLQYGSKDRAAAHWVGSPYPRVIHPVADYPVTPAAFSLDGLRLALVSEDQVVQLWDGRTGTCIAALSGQSHSVKFSVNSTTLASASRGHTVGLWDGKTGDHPCEHFGEVSFVAFSADGSQLISGSFGVTDHFHTFYNTVLIWDTTYTNQPAIQNNGCGRVLPWCTELPISFGNIKRTHSLWLDDFGS